MLALYGAGCIGASLLDPSMTPGSVANAFAHSLVPIAFAYVSAHYFTFLVFQGQTIIPLASEPLGHGSDFFGTAGETIDYSLVGAASVWYIQVILVVVGHALALALAHDRALVLYNHAARCGALAVLDARRDGGVHVARPVPPQPGECLTEVR